MRFRLNPALVIGTTLEATHDDSKSILSERYKEVQQSLYYDYFMNESTDRIREESNGN